MTRPDNYAELRKKRIKHMRPAAKQALQDIEKQSHDAWLDQILEEIALNYEHKDHDDSCLAAQAWREAKASIQTHIDKLVEKARQETHALYPDKGEYITKAEAERMVLKARIDEIGSFAGYEDGDWYGMIRIPMQRFVERIAELKSDESNRKSVTTATPRELSLEELRTFLRDRISGISTAAEEDILTLITAEKAKQRQALDAMKENLK